MNVSIIIPCRNEKDYIGSCLDSVINSDYPLEEIEILVVDGKSEDGSIEIIRHYCEKYPFVKYFENKKKIIPAALNIGVKNAKSDVILRIDAHSRCSKNYISKCVRCLNQYNADNVGGKWIIIPQKNSVLGKSIAYVLSNPFGVGNAHYRIGSEIIRSVDTVPFGCYKKSIFTKVGLYDENMERSEDYDLNLRIRKAGGKIIFVPDIVSYYYARSGLIEFMKHNFNNGIWITYPIKFGKMVFSWRHIIPLIFVVFLLITSIMSLFLDFFYFLFFLTIVLYFFAIAYFSFKIAKKEKKIQYLPISMLVFTMFHVSYGLGSVFGILKLFFWIK